MATLLFPGRHILHPQFQEEYLLGHLRIGLERASGLWGRKRPAGDLDRIIFAITSANQSHSRFNPVSLDVRAIGVDRFARRLKEGLGIDYRIVPIPHYQPTGHFADFIIKEIAEASEHELRLTPADTVVMTSTPELIEQFRASSFGVLPAERSSPDGQSYIAATPLEVLGKVAEAGDKWDRLPELRQLLSPATFSLWKDFPDVPRRIARLFRDPLLTDSGSLTEMRNYSVYAQGMSAKSILDLKYHDIHESIESGRIVDEGCADGALLVPIARDFPDSDLVGIEITGEFLARCIERQRAMEFGGTYIHFHQRNIMDPIFEPDSIDTTICNSTVHELWSYGKQEKTVRAYLKEKFRQTRRGGRIIIRDVVGPEDKDRPVLLWCNDSDGHDDPAGRLEGMSTAARLRRFARDFLAEMRLSGRRGARTVFHFREEQIDHKTFFGMRLRDAVEFMLKKDYLDNWDCEMNEEFAFWDLLDWKRELQEAGFAIRPESRAYLNPWIAKNRWEGKTELFARSGQPATPLPFPPTTMVLVGEKR